jgi:membrane-bound metal-dependent hydrolase YbcI (DUF457 family)
MNCCKRVFDEIRRLNIPAKVKAELLMLWAKAKKLVETIIRFIQRHREFAHTILLGAIVAWLLAHIPWIGSFLALCALVTAAAIGVLKELRIDIAGLFEPVVKPA